MSLFPVVSGIWGIVVIGLLLLAVRLSYRIEKRSDPDKFKRWPIRYANVFGVALNINVARDSETQQLRRQMLIYLALISGLAVAFALFVIIAIPGSS